MSKRKSISILLILTLVLPLLIFNYVDAATELIQNGGMESGTNSPANWTSWSTGSPTFTWDANEKHSGAKSLKIQQNSTWASSWYQSISGFVEGKHYKISGWIKTDNVSGGSEYAQIAVICKDSGNNILSENASIGVSGIQGWTYVSFEFFVTRGTAKLEAAARLWGSMGTAWFDDISVVDTDSIIYNGSFESGTTAPQSWVTWTNGSPQFTWDEAEKVSGKKSAKIVNGSQWASSWYQQLPPVTGGKTYSFEGWIKTENVNALPGHGAFISFECKDSSNNLIHDFWSDPFTGNNGWTKVSSTVTIPANTASVNVCIKLWGASGVAWFDNIAVKSYSSLTVKSSPNSQTLDGFGAEWDPKFWLNINTRNGVNQSDWDIIKTRISNMKLQKVRVMVLPEWFEPHNDNNDANNIDWSKMDFSTSSPEMDCLYKYLDVCQELGVDASITWWCVQRYTADPWLAFPGCTEWCSAPNNLAEAAENISALLQYLLNTKNYTCIKELIVYNEPSWAFYNNSNKVDFNYYKQLITQVHNRLVNDGLRNRISLVGSDDAQNLTWFTNTKNNLDSILDKYNSHNYAWTVNDSNIASNIAGFVSSRVSQITKPFYFGEFGTGNVVGAYKVTDVDTYDRGLYLPVHAINTLKAGGSGDLYWSLHDVYYYDQSDPNIDNGGLMETGLWAYKNKGWAVRPTYHSWALINKYTRVGSQIYDITGAPASVDAVALKTASGKWTYLLANRSNYEQNLTIQNPLLNSGSLSKYIFSEQTLPVNDAIISSSDSVGCAGGQLTCTIPAKSFMVLSDLI